MLRCARASKKNTRTTPEHLNYIHTHTHTHTRTRTRTHAHAHAHTYDLIYSLSTHAHIHTHSLSHTHTLSRTHTHSLAHTLSRTHTLSLLVSFRPMIQNNPETRIHPVDHLVALLFVQVCITRAQAPKRDPRHAPIPPSPNVTDLLACLFFIFYFPHLPIMPSKTRTFVWPQMHLHLSHCIMDRRGNSEFGK